MPAVLISSNTIINPIAENQSGDLERAPNLNGDIRTLLDRYSRVIGPENANTIQTILVVFQAPHKLLFAANY